MSLENQLHRYRALIQTARCFGRAMDRRTLINEILDRSQEVMRTEACTLFLPDPETRELILHSTDPKLAALAEPLRIPAGKGIAGAVFETKQPVNIHNAQEDARHLKQVGEQVGMVTRAMLTIPLLEGAECVGVLQALNPLDRETFDKDDEEVFEGFGGLIANALMRLEAARREIEIARSNQQMEVAREIQEAFLPAPMQKFPFCHVHLKNFPAYAVGGDFCCVHRVSGNRLLVGLGDVTGKGLPASLTMARATAMIKATAGQIDHRLGGECLGAWVTWFNEQLVGDLWGGRFIGLTFMLADATYRTLEVCSAGQFAPLHFNGKRWENVSMQNHMPLGIAPGIKYQSVMLPLVPGELWLLYSDGITEARNRAGEDYTIGRFHASLPLKQSSGKTISAAVAAWKEFVGSAPQHDDASLLLLDWRGKPPEQSLSTECSVATLKKGREFVERWAVYAGFDDVTAGQIVTACDEAATNVLRHGYNNQPGPLDYQAEVDETDLIIWMIDHAKPVDPKQVRGRDLADVRPGGLGTVIIEQVFDEVVYRPDETGMLLKLRKALP